MNGPSIQFTAVAVISILASPSFMSTMSGHSGSNNVRSDNSSGMLRTATLRANVAQLARILGQTTGPSKGDVATPDAVIKELLQNSHDAIKAAQHKELIEKGVITIRTNPKDKTIAMTDNGIGMSPVTVENALLTIGGSDKAGLPLHMRSGGLGLRKTLFLLGTESFKLSTVHNGIKTEVNATAELKSCLVL